MRFRDATRWALFDFVMTIWRGLYGRHARRLPSGPRILSRDEFLDREAGKALIREALGGGPPGAYLAGINARPAPSLPPDDDGAEALAVLDAAGESSGWHS